MLAHLWYHVNVRVQNGILGQWEYHFSINKMVWRFFLLYNRMTKFHLVRTILLSLKWKINTFTVNVFLFINHKFRNTFSVDIHKQSFSLCKNTTPAGHDGSHL
jgi:hypothetical protein